MTDMLCRWLNEELLLSQVVEPKTFAKAFSSGYLFGEILHRYQLQKDFHMFMKKERSISMLNNFTRLEPAFHLLGISFSATTAQELMQEKQGVAAHLVQQLYISLERKKKKAVISGTDMSAAVGLRKKDHDFCRNGNLQKISKPLEKKLQTGRSTLAKVHKTKSPIKQEEKSKRNSDIVSRFQISYVQELKPSPLNLRRQQQRQKKLAEDVQKEIAEFESNRGKLASSHLRHLDGCVPFIEGPKASKSVPNTAYVQQIQQRLKENISAREQRDKKVEIFLIEQAKAREAGQYAKHEEYLLKRYTRPTKQEQRLTAQLSQIRKQKEVIVSNRLFREQQIQQMRDKDSQEAVKRKAVLTEQEKMARAEEIRWDLDFCKRFDADRDQLMYQKHTENCKEIVEHMVDLATKVGEYRRHLSGNPVPEKQMKHWKEVLLRGLPLYGSSDVEDLEHSVDPVELQKQDTLNNLDYDEYINMAGDWVYPEEERKLATSNNHILGYVVARLKNLAHPLCKKPAESSFPYFRLKACVLGKLCSGKSSCLAKIAQAHGIHVLSIQELVNKALNSYRNRETATEKELSAREQESRVESDDVPQDVASIKLSTQAMYGQEVENAMVAGNSLPFELLVKIVIGAIQNIPENSDWILDGFPLNVKQAYLLEKALNGSAAGEQCVVRTRQTDLAVDPDLPNALPPPPPVLDLALLLDVSDECAVSRAVHLAYATAPDSKPEYVYTSHIPRSHSRITDFNKTWPKLEEWFEAKQKILIRVDANVDEEELFNRVESALLQAKRPLQEVVLPAELSVNGTDSKDVFRTRSLDQLPIQELTVSLEPTESSRSLKIEKEESRKIQTSCRIPGVSRMAFLMNERSATYFNKQLPPEVAEALHIHWKNVCEMYVNNTKAVLQELRLENTWINQHFFNIEEEFKDYLQRQDSRQQVISHWQKAFNSVADDMRSEDETKAELHLRLQELSDDLLNICKKRKEENEQERAVVMGGTWLSDSTALIANYYTIFIQVELDRFQDSVCILKKYDLGVNINPLLKPPLNQTTVSLLDTSSTQEAQSQHSEQDQPQKKLLEDYYKAVAAINKLLPSKLRSAQQREVKPKPTGKVQEAPAVDKGSKKSLTEKNKKGSTSPPASPLESSPEHAEVKPTVSTTVEYSVALSHEEEAAKVRITLMKDHGLKLVDLIQRNAEQTFNLMEKCLNEHFEKEKKSIEQLEEVVCHHIESGAKLLNELVLDHSHFYLNGDYHMMALPPPPSCSSHSEKPSQSTLSILQLESLCQQFRHIAPSGLLSCLEFLTFLKVIITTNKSRNTLPASWVKTTQLMEIVASLRDEHDLMDWRRFLLGCALPWPSPSVTELLDALQHLKAADFENKGYISEGQYLQTQLWFPIETVVETPEDPSKPPYDHLSELFKFFFQLFADHSFQPPRLNYTSMLLYLSADPNPKQGFVRALSVVVGQRLKQTSSTQLVKSMPSLDEASDISFTEVDVDYSRSESPSSSALFGNQKVSVPALLTVLDHSSSNKDSHSKYTKLVDVYEELGYRPEDSITFSVLSTHSFIQHLMETSTKHQLVNIYHLLHSGGEC